MELLDGSTTVGPSLLFGHASTRGETVTIDYPLNGLKWARDLRA